jgi:hypothetical protein
MKQSFLDSLKGMLVEEAKYRALIEGYIVEVRDPRKTYTLSSLCYDTVCLYVYDGEGVVSLAEFESCWMENRER